MACMSKCGEIDGNEEIISMQCTCTGDQTQLNHPHLKKTKKQR